MTGVAMGRKQAKTLFDRPLARDWLAWWAGFIAALAVASTADMYGSPAASGQYQATAFLFGLVFNLAAYMGLMVLIPGLIRRAHRRSNIHPRDRTSSE